MFNLFNKKNRTHENVGRILYSPYFGQHIIVTAYNTRRTWYFKVKGSSREHKAITDFNAMLKIDQERKERQHEQV